MHACMHVGARGQSRAVFLTCHSPCLHETGPPPVVELAGLAGHSDRGTSEDEFPVSVLTFLSVGSRDQTQVAGIGSKPPNPLNHLVSPGLVLFIQSRTSA